MPWCPQCDEIFPSGPSCPRCRTQLLDMADVSGARDAGQGGALPQLKVPRRLRRAFDRMNRRPAPPRQMLTLVLGLLVFLAGMAVGQIGTRPLPVVVDTARGEPMDVPEHTAVEYLLHDRGGEFAGLMLRRQSLDSGTTDPGRRLALPPGQVRVSRADTRMRALGGSIAVMVASNERWLVAALPQDGTPLAWLPALDAVWEDAASMLIAEEAGTVSRWTFGAPLRETIPGLWAALHQTPGGAALEAWNEGGRQLFNPAPEGPVATIALPGDDHVLAVGPRARTVLLVAGGRPALWDGTTMSPIEIHGYDPIAAAFSSDAGRVALTLREQREPGASAAISLLVADVKGRQVMLERLTVMEAGSECPSVPVWEPAGGWVYLAPGDRSIYAVQVGGGKRSRARIDNTGCALAWAP